ncbi:hypothetical protein FPV67DRAFT_1196458 [Lyophyllum atratum]|nr:hypothetical protein FPV67DRAFT_1196458 [Lyophyllum atratum]
MILYPRVGFSDLCHYFPFSPMYMHLQYLCSRVVSFRLGPLTQRTHNRHICGLQGQRDGYAAGDTGGSFSQHFLLSAPGAGVSPRDVLMFSLAACHDHLVFSPPSPDRTRSFCPLSTSSDIVAVRSVSGIGRICKPVVIDHISAPRRHNQPGGIFQDHSEQPRFEYHLYQSGQASRRTHQAAGTLLSCSYCSTFSLPSPGIPSIHPSEP